MNWKLGLESGPRALHYLGPDEKTGAGLWAGLKANPANLPSSPITCINPPSRFLEVDQ